jgi:hypothetical protein
MVISMEIRMIPMLTMPSTKTIAAATAKLVRYFHSKAGANKHGHKYGDQDESNANAGINENDSSS